MIEIDGSVGEGGGQILRTALALSCIGAKAFRIFNIRKKRAKPGLMRQHQVAVQAAARICRAEVAGDRIGSEELTFAPGRIVSGAYSFDIGTAGSTTMVLQTVVPALLFAKEPSHLFLSGGTHVPFSPSWEYLSQVYAPTLRKLGVELELEMERVGFYPKGGGRVRCSVHPCQAIAPLVAEERGELVRITGRSAAANLTRSIAQRQADAAESTLRSVLGDAPSIEIEVREVPSFSPGTLAFIRAEYRNAIAGFSSLGARGKPAEAVGTEAAADLLSHHKTGMPVDPHLADQLVLFLALARGESLFRTSCVTNHLETNLQVAGKFLDFEAELVGEKGEPGTVRIVGNRS